MLNSTGVIMSLHNLPQFVSNAGLLIFDLIPGKWTVFYPIISDA